MMRNFATLDTAGPLAGKRVFAALDLNVPLKGDTVVDGYRIARARKTLDYLRAAGARTLLVSHRTHARESLAPVCTYLKKSYQVVFAQTLEGARVALKNAERGSFVLLENIRRCAGEAEHDEAFAKKLAGLADLYVNEAFSASHRAHASIVGVPAHLPHYAGFLFVEEVERLSRAFAAPHPFLCILGGAKFETKLPLVQKFLARADTLYLCGALANDIFRARGEDVGASLVSSVSLPESVSRHPNLRIPADVVRKEGRIVDAGEKSIADLQGLVRGARFILWNGPLGEYQSGRFGTTEAVARAIAEGSAESIIGGGDTLAVVSQLGLLERFSFVSTGGGAMLQFLADETLPGIEALR